MMRGVIGGGLLEDLVCVLAGLISAVVIGAISIACSATMAEHDADATGVVWAAETEGGVYHAAIADAVVCKTSPRPTR